MGIGVTLKSFPLISNNPTFFGIASASMSEVMHEDPGCIVWNFYV